MVNETEILLTDMQSYYLAFIEQLPQIVLGLVLLILFYVLSTPLARILLKPLSYRQTSALIQIVSERIVSLVIILFGVYLFLRLVGLSEFAVAILSGTGVAGLIIGFAFKDIAENFMASLLLSIQKPFRLNEVIQVNGHLGVVKQVTARATTLVDFDGNHIQIPNATVYKNTIMNFTANPKSRGQFVVGIGYDNDVSAAQQLGLQVLAGMPTILNDPEPQILIDELGSSSYNLKVYFWTNTHEYSLIKVSSLAIKNIVSAYEQANISMPDDAREIVFPQGLPVALEQNEELLISQKNAESEDTAVTSFDKPTQEAASKSEKKSSADTSVKSTPAIDDVSSDNEDIRKQANAARDPEQGKNIL